MNLSIIVPVYNVEKYLEKCLESLINQTLDKSQYEIIIVNDGSLDNSQNIIDRYANEHKNIIAFLKENGGLSDARNYGLERACGEYVAFVDSDDYVDCRMYEIMLNKANQGNFDMVVCDFVEVYDDHNVNGKSRLQKDLVDKEEIRQSMIDFYPSAWNKLYKKELFDTLRFKKGVWFEDVEMLYRLLPRVNSVGVVHENFYYYIQRNNSISKSVDPRIFHYIDNWNGIIEYYKENHYMEKYREEIEYSYVRYLYATFIKAALKYDKYYFNKAMNKAINEVKKQFPRYRKNKYFYKSLKGIYCLLFSQMIGKVMYKIKRCNLKG